MGDQRDYGLVTGSIWNTENKPSTTNSVTETMKPVAKKNATIEAELGETIIGPDKNGQIFHAKIGGKRHSEGGTFLDAPDGSFVFSDTAALTIKNKDLLSKIFGISRKKSMTPAELAKKYGVNQYYDILNNPEASPIEKRTAQLMLDNNMKKLGQIALIQEGMKGFPDGIPDIALPLFGSDIASAQPAKNPMAESEGAMMRNGGTSLPSFQGGSAVDWDEEYQRQMKRFNDWKKKFEDPNLTENERQLLKTQGDDIAKDLELFDVPGDPGFNLSWLGFKSGLYEPSVGTRQGRVEDAADAIRNIIEKYENKQKVLNLTEKNRENEIKNKDFLKSAIEKSEQLLEDIKNNPNNEYSNEQNSITAFLDYAYDLSTSPGVGGPGFLPSTSGIPKDELITKFPFLQDIFKEPTEVYNPVDYLSTREGIEKTTSNPPIPMRGAESRDLVDPNSDGYFYVNPTQPAKAASSPKSQPALKSPKYGGYTPQQIESMRKEIAIEYNVPPDSIQTFIVIGELQRAGVPTKRSGGSIISFDPVSNTVLDVMQNGSSKKPSYDFMDEAFRKYLQDQGVEFTTPSYFPSRSRSGTIGSQTPGSEPRNFTLTPEGTIIPAGGIQGYTGINDLVTYLNENGVDISKYQGDWTKDISDTTKGRPAHRKAVQWVLNEVNRINAERAKEYGLDPTQLPSQFDPNVTDYDILGQENLLGIKFLKPKPAAPAAPAAPSAQAPVVKKDITAPAPKKPNYQSGNVPSPFPDYALFNLYNAMGIPVNKGPLPPFSQFSYRATPPTLLDPARAIAQQQGLAAQTQEEMSTFQPGPVSRANMIASQAKTADPIAAIMAKYDEANAQIMNQFNQTKDTLNRDMLVRNAAAKDKYQDQLATREQNYQNALNEKNQKVVDEYTRARREQMGLAATNQMNPSYAFDSFGNIIFKPGYRPQDTQNPMDLFNKLIEQGVSPDAASRAAFASKATPSPYNYDPTDYIFNSQS
jgi:hypothetical protein